MEVVGLISRAVWALLAGQDFLVKAVCVWCQRTFLQEWGRKRQGGGRIKKNGPASLPSLISAAVILGRGAWGLLRAELWSFVVLVLIELL